MSECIHIYSHFFSFFFYKKCIYIYVYIYIHIYVYIYIYIHIIFFPLSILDLTMVNYQYYGLGKLLPKKLDPHLLTHFSYPCPLSDSLTIKIQFK